MNKSVKTILFALIAISVLAIAYTKFSGPGAFAFGASPEEEFVKSDLDSLSATYTKLSSEVYQRTIALYNLNKQIAYADSTLHGGKFLYLLTFACVDMSVNIESSESDNHVFTLTLPVTRSFYNVVEEGNTLQADYDYGFKFAQAALAGKNVTIVKKQIIHGTGE